MIVSEAEAIGPTHWPKTAEDAIKYEKSLAARLRHAVSQEAAAGRVAELRNLLLSDDVADHAKRHIRQEIRRIERKIGPQIS